MDKDALILIISIIAVGWILAQISSAAGRKSRQKAAEQKAPKAESIKTIFQYMDASQALLDRVNELNNKYIKLIADKHQLIAIMNDPAALDKLNQIEKDFNNCVLDATVLRDQIDRSIQLSDIDLDLYNKLEDIVTYMEMYIQAIEELDVDMYDAEDRNAYEDRTAWENEARAGMHGREYQEYYEGSDAYRDEYRYQRQTGHQNQNSSQYNNYNNGSQQQNYQQNNQQNQYQQQQQQSYQQQSSGSTQDTDSYFAGCTTLEEVEKRYKALAKVFHPDSQTGNDVSFKQLQTAYETAKKKF